MRNLLAFISLIVVPSAIFGQGRPADEAQIRAQVSGWSDAWNRDDAMAIALYYDVDADRTFAHGDRRQGRTEIHRLYEEAFSQAPPEGVERTLKIHDLTIRFITDDVAVVDYGFRATGIPILPNVEVDNRSTLVMVKRGGQWLRAAQRNWVPFEPTAECIRRCRYSGRPR